MSFSRNNNLIDDPENDLDPTNEQVTQVVPEANHATEIPYNDAVGFNTLTLTLTANTPVRLFGHDVARKRALINTSANADVLIGDNATVYSGQGFNMTNHNAGGAIELQTTEEVWATYVAASGTVVVYVYIERTVN